ALALGARPATLWTAFGPLLAGNLRGAVLLHAAVDHHAAGRAVQCPDPAVPARGVLVDALAVATRRLALAAGHRPGDPDLAPGTADHIPHRRAVRRVAGHRPARLAAPRPRAAP